MLKKLATLSLSLLLCLSLLPGQASAMDAPENDSPAQAEDVGNQVSPENADAGIAPCRADGFDFGAGGLGDGIGANDTDGSGRPWGSGMIP